MGFDEGVSVDVVSMCLSACACGRACLRLRYGMGVEGKGGADAGQQNIFSI